MILNSLLKGKIPYILFLLGAVLLLLFFIYPHNLTTLVSSQTQEVRVLFLGDMMFDRTVRHYGEAGGYDRLLGTSTAVINEYDIVVGNLEGPITPYESVSVNSTPQEPGNTQFTFSEEIFSMFPANPLFLFHLGNNHILDFGLDGLKFTEHAISSSEFQYFGDIQGQNLLTETTIINGITITFVSYNQFLGKGVSTVVEAIANSRKNSDFVVVFTHWGEEYVEEMPVELQNIAYSFIDAGADLVVGTHPHVVGDVLEYKGKKVYYSLGNFIFDQYWNESVRCGEVLAVTFPRIGEISFKSTQTSFSDGRVVWGECI